MSTPTPETLLFDQTVRGTPLEKYWSAIGKCEKLERERDEAIAALSGRTVSCSRCNEVAKQNEAMRELLREIRGGEVNAQDEADKFLRDHEPSELSKMREAIQDAVGMLGLCRHFLHSMNGDTAKCDYTISKLKPFLPRSPATTAPLLAS